MSRPKVRADNINAVADYYAEHRPRRVLAGAGYLGMRAAFHPRVSYADGAQAQIRELLADRSQRAMLVGNHLSAIDPIALASLVTRPTFWPLIGNTFILAKPPLFQNPFLRRAVDGLGAVPVIRNKDLEPGQETIDRHTALTQVYADRITEGEHSAGYADGERKRNGDRTKIENLRKGMGHIACAVDDSVGIQVVPLGVWYAGRKFTPNLFVGNPYEAPRESPGAFVEALEPRLQYVLDEAIELA